MTDALLVLAICDCGGHLVTVDPDVDVLEGRCDRCGFEASVHRSKIDAAWRARRRLLQAELPAEFAGRRFERTEDNAGALMLISGWVTDYGTWRQQPEQGRGRPPKAPALWGPVGRGKSHLLAAICSRVIRECDVPVLFRSTRRLLRELQQFEQPADADQAWRRVTTVDVLALDDPGAERSTDWRHDQIADLIDERYQRALPILIATNFPPAGWEDALDERSISRLRAMTLPIEVRGPDRRQTQLDTTIPQSQEGQ